MNDLKRKPLYVALIAGLATLGAAPPADAVHVNPDSLGQVLIFPYYTVRAGQFTAISITNSQNNTKAVKVRFLEGKNGREAIDFNLFLAPTDMWTAAVVATAEGARMITNDNACVTPSDLFAESRVDGLGLALNAFKPYGYTGALADNPAFASLDRTREGFFEIVEMGVIDDDLISGNSMTAGNTAPLVTGYLKHNAAGVPANCGALDAFEPFAGNPAPIRFPNTGAVGALMQPPRGGLSGRASIINSATGANYTFSATALDAWSATVQHTEPGNASPQLSAANPPVSGMLTSSGVVTATWTTGRDAVTAALMRNIVMNEFVLDAGTQSQTDWIITFPTKREYVPVGFGPAPASAQPFANNFHNTVNDGSSDPYAFSIFNREEQVPGTVSILPQPLLPPVASATGAQMVWQANIIPFGPASVLSSINTNPLISGLQAFAAGATSVASGSVTPSLRGTQGPNGWFAIYFESATQRFTPVSATLTGLGNTVPPRALLVGTHVGMPIVGAMLHNYRNTGVASQYGGVIDHRYSRYVDLQ